MKRGKEAGGKGTRQRREGVVGSRIWRAEKMERMKGQGGL